MYTLNLRQVSYALSEALDMVGIDDLYHGKRVAYIASRISHTMGFSTQRVDSMINIGMFHDCGVSNTDTHANLVMQLDWDGSNKHCLRGADLVKKVKFYKEYSEIILYHHTHWNKLKDIEMNLENKIDANIVHLADRVDALRSQKKSHEKIIQILEKQKNIMFMPDLVDAFIEIASPNSFWLYLESHNLELFLHEWISQEKDKEYSFEDLKEVALMFSNIVDAKSKFTGEHSLNVAKVSTYIANKFKLPLEQTQVLELAALLHDLGKLRVDDGILDKHGPLDKEERIVMDRHGFDSEMILRKIDGFKEIACLASSHHESLDGKGYPYQKKESELSLEARILMLSDIFQALVQNRPYRSQLSKEKIMEILHDLQEKAKVDVNVLKVIEENLDELYEIAN